MPNVFDYAAKATTFEETYHQIHPIVRHAVRNVLGFSHRDVDDVSQEVMMLMLRIFGSPFYARIRNQGAFFRIVARRKALSHRRQLLSSQEKCEQYIAEASSDTMIIDLDQETTASLFQQLYQHRIPDLMPQRRWQMFEYRYQRGLDIKEIANLVEVSEQVVRFQLSLASGEVVAAMKRILKR